MPGLHRITYYEIRRGLLHAGSGRKAEQFEKLAAASRVSSLDLAGVRRAAEMCARLWCKGIPLDDADILMAKTTILRSRKEMVKTFSRPWLTPLVVLIILLLAFAFRWDYNASKTYDWGVVKWKTDRWDSRKWVEAYDIDRPSYFVEVPLDRAGNRLDGKLEQSAWRKRNLLTVAWGISVVSAGTWFILASRERHKPAE